MPLELRKYEVIAQTPITETVTFEPGRINGFTHRIDFVDGKAIVYGDSIAEFLVNEGYIVRLIGKGVL